MSSLRLSPGSSLLAVALFALGLLTLQSGYFLHQPWLGVTLKAGADDSLVVAEVASDGPNHNRVAPQQSLQAIRLPQGDLALRPELLYEEPDVLPDLAQFHAFMRDQGAIASQLRLGSATFITAEGEELSLHSAQRPLHQLPLIYWAQQLFGIVGLLIGTAVWAFRPRSSATRLLLLNGIGFYLACISAALYSSRELALDGELFLWLSNLNHAGVMLFSVSFMGLLWHYPRPIANFPLERLTLPLFGLFYLANISYLTGAPSMARYLAILLAFLPGILFGIIQWRRSRGLPVERAALKWFLLSIFLGSGIFVLAATLPVLLGTTPIAEQSLLLGTFLLMYAGMALGVVRYRLFDLDRWWLQVWIWFFGGVALIATDLLLIYVAKLSQLISLGLALLLVGWVYFPLRQRLIGRFAGELRIEQLYQDSNLINTMLSATRREELEAFWAEQLEQLFRPMQLLTHTHTQPLEQVKLSEQGAALLIPNLAGDGHFELHHRSHGSRLFSSSDRTTCDSLLWLFRFAVKRIEEREAGAELERQRISRDLHDDLGAKLLRLIHSAPDESSEELAREAMVVLRESLNNLQGRPLSLLTLIGRLRSELDERLEPKGIALEWDDQGCNQNPTLPARYVTNLLRILRELTSNALKHAELHTLAVQLSSVGQRLQIIFEQREERPRQALEAWQEGRGWSSLRTRSAELGGVVRVELNPSGALQVVVELPLMGEE